MNENERPFCFCQTRGISTHYHNPEKYGCPMQPVPRRTEQEGGPPNDVELVTHLGLMPEEAARLREEFTARGSKLYPLDDVLAEAGIDSEEDWGDDELLEWEDELLKLNPEDPFERVLIDMVAMNRRKRRDYALDGSPFSNFDTTAAAMGMPGFGAVESAIFNVNQKLARLRSLRANGRLDDTANETVDDTYLDLAIYACIALAISRYPEGKVA